MMDMKINSLPSGNASLEKGLDLFSLISGDRGKTQLSQLAGDLQLPRSTLYRMVGVLERAGLVTRLARGRYDVGLKLAEHLEGISIKSQMARIARPVLRELAMASGATAHLGVLEQDMVTYLVKETAPAAAEAASFTRENAQLEAYCSGIGKVLLANLPEAERSKYLENGPFVAMTTRTITDPAALRTALRHVRDRQHAIDDGEIADDLYCLAVPVRDRFEDVTAAISLSFPRASRSIYRDQDALGRLRAGAEDISAKFGYRG
jgi:DNA-binding IclR family transcriptional regulator